MCFSLLKNKSVGDIKATGSSNSVNYLRKLKSGVTVMGLRLFPALEHLVNLLGLFSPFHVKHNVLIVYQVSTYSVPLHSVSS